MGATRFFFDSLIVQWRLSDSGDLDSKVGESEKLFVPFLRAGGKSETIGVVERGPERGPARRLLD